MSTRLPPLAALRAFEAAARHLSFTRAADELAMTQAAVSYQIKVLEERVGSPLFLRRPRQVMLTETGQGLAVAATDAFRRIAEAYETARTGGQGTLSISTIPTFAANWLALHLGAFQMDHPKIAVRIETSDLLVDLARDNIDVAIRSGATGQWPGLDAHHLFRETFTPMLSPALADSIGGVREPADLLRLPDHRLQRRLVEDLVRAGRRRRRRGAGGAPAQPVRLAGLRGSSRRRGSRRRHPDAGHVQPGTRGGSLDPAFRHPRPGRPLLLAGP